MSELTTSDILGGAVTDGTAPAPYATWGGQLWSRESASAKRTELMADPAYTAAALNDTAKQAELSALWQIENYGTAPQPSENFGDIERQMDDRAGRELASYAEHLRQSVDFTDEQIHDIIHRRPISIGEKQFHERQLSILKSDREFVARYLRGDREAVLKMQTHISGTALPVGTAEQEQAWRARYPFKKAG